MFLYIAFSGIDIKKSLQLIYSADVIYIFMFLLLFIASHFLRSVRWKFMINSLKPDAKLVNLFGATMIGYGVNCIIPRLGEVYRGLFLGKWEGLSRSSMLGTIVVERIIDVIMLIFAVIISIFVYNGDLFKDVVWLKSTIYAASIISIGLILFIILFVIWKKEFSELFIKKISKYSPKIADKIDYIFHTLLDGFSSIRGVKNWVFTCILSVVIILGYSATTYVGMYMFHFDNIHVITFGMAWVISTIGAFGVIIPTPGGTGSYHAITIFILVELFKFDLESAAAYAILTHILSYVVFISSAFFFISLINKLQKNKGAKSENFLSVFKLKSGD